MADARLELQALLSLPRDVRPKSEAASPYPGLRSFTEEDAGRFFGREMEVEALWQRLRRQTLLAVIGPSGAGKTSFVRAGVVASRPEGWAAVVFTPGRAPLRALAQALVPEFASDLEALRGLVAFDEGDDAIVLVTRWRRSHEEALVVVDQFEEVFTQIPPDVQVHLVTLLARLAEESDVHVLLSLRDDFLMRCHDYEPLAPLFRDLTPLGALTRENLGRALVEPARHEGYRFEDEALVDEMVSAVEGERGALPLLAFAVARLWEQRDRGRRVLTRAAYEEIGGVAGALSRHAEFTLERVGFARQDAVREIFRNLVTSQGTRAVAGREELVSLFPDRETAERVLQELIDARLLTSYEAEAADDEGPRRRVEIVHESLLEAWPRLVRWRTQDADSAQFRDQVKQAARLWDERGRSDDLLWTGAAYSEFELWRKRYPGALTALEQAFAGAMTRRAQRRRRARRWTLSAAFAVLFAVTAAVTSLWRSSEASRGQAVASARRAEASRLVALGRLELDRYPTAALAYARKSLEVADTGESRRLAVEALWRGPGARIMSLGTALSWRAAFSPDGTWLAAYPFSDKVLLFHHDGGGRVIGGYRQPNAAPWIGFTPRGDALFARTPAQSHFRIVSVPDGGERAWVGPDLPDNDPARLRGSWPLPAGILFGPGPENAQLGDVALTLYPYDGGPRQVLGSYRGAEVTALAVEPDGERLAIARGRRVFIRRVTGPALTAERQIATLGNGRLLRMSFSPRGDLLAAGEDTGRLTLWPLRSQSAAPVRDWALARPDGAFPITFDAAGERLVWGSTSAAFLWDVDGPPDADPLELRLPDQAEAKQGLFHPGGEWLATANSYAVAFWAMRQPRSYALGAGEHNLFAVTFTADSQQLVSCALDVRVWPLTAEAGKRRSVNLPGRQYCYGLAASPDGRRLLVGSPGYAFLADTSAATVRVLADDTPGGQFMACAFDRTGRRAASAPAFFGRPAQEKAIWLWDLPSGGVRRIPLVPPGETAKGQDWGARAMAFTPDGDLLVGGSGGVRRFDLDGGKDTWIWRLDRSMTAKLAASTDGRHVVAVAYPHGAGGTDKHPLMVIDLQGGRRRVTSHGTRVVAVALDRAARVIVTGDNDGVVRVGPIDGSEPHLLPGHTSFITSVAVSPDGRWIASADGEQIRLWPMPDLSKPPFHTLARDRLIASLQQLTNLQVVEDSASLQGYRLEIGPFPGWQTVPTW